jgi:hypothetical protein
MWFHKWLYSSFDQIPINPWVFVVCSHEKEDPNRIAAKLMMEHFFIEKMSKSMDPWGIYIVQTQDKFWIVIGSNCKNLNLEMYLAYARNYIKTL